MTNNTVTNSDVSNTSEREYASYKGFHNVKNSSFISDATIDASSPNLTPLNTPRSYLLAGLRTAPCLDKQAEHELRSQKNEETYAPFQNVYRKDVYDARQLGVSTYPHMLALSPRTAQGLGLSTYQKASFPVNSVSEPSTPYQHNFDEFRGMTRQKYSPLLFSDSSFTQPILSQQYSCQSRKVKPAPPTASGAFFKGFSPNHISEQHASPYSPMVHESHYGLPSYSSPLELHSLAFSGSASPYFSQNSNLKKNKYFPVFHTNTNGSAVNVNSETGFHGNSAPLNKEGVPYRQPRGPPPMEELLSPNESENKNFSLRLRRQAINKILHAGVQRQNIIFSTESTQDGADDLLKV
ncbi:hypothetical protein PNEG_00018 [Pneumocystis murina B123]|uniref:Uncharacterized protein n=1 Tax=Pneumocystis murina (strain B123) TaxID=1069680 RepID=M7PM75_PNEMU|nr:hypothetical protein PNEG_00018 [Pneumocystis murina B123]EMR11574.1 hypothetical protein PNEG_00018 [Pneumocystis murina B123]